MEVTYKYTTYSTSLEEDFKAGDSFYKYVNKYLGFCTFQIFPDSLIQMASVC